MSMCLLYVCIVVPFSSIQKFAKVLEYFGEDPELAPNKVCNV
jgi:hypothetical protein